MKLQGTATLHADREQVFAALTDPGVLARCIPGCESLDRTGVDSYKMTVSAGVGAIRGRYDGKVTLTDLVRPEGYVMNAQGAGGAGTVDATCRIDLVSDGDQTQLTYSADATVGGPVAGVGQRMISAVAKRMAGQFFSAVDDDLTGAQTPLEPVSGASAESAGAPGDSAVQRGYASYLPARRRGELVPVDARPLLLAGAGGALIALLGAAVGGWLARRSR
ncbi:MAG: carbon monoxide dehydrogenase subunit G [Geodermatophilaceae bacterium]|nr:carbon monoxide dehydrogenase subunit G [Geodermatophilaceae bacterium]